MGSGILWHTLAYSGILFHALAYSGIINASLITADGAYHCPVGSIWPFLAPSGALIAIPTYYWSAPHFFRSHRSSTLDFRFLSHYSYIKAIMLYKGNHWTQCAGFMDASWVRLGITNDDLGRTWALLWQNLARLWHTLAHSGVLWHTLACSGILPM